MLYRRLGKTELNVSVVGVGTWQLGGEWGKVYEQSEVDQMIRRAGELGINLIDTRLDTPGFRSVKKAVVAR